MVLIQPSQTADGTAAHLDGRCRAGDIVVLTNLGEVDIAVTVGGLLGSFVVGVCQQFFALCRCLGRGQGNGDLHGRFRHVIHLKVQGSQFAGAVRRVYQRVI